MPLLRASLLLNEEVYQETLIVECPALLLQDILNSPCNQYNLLAIMHHAA